MRWLKQSQFEDFEEPEPATGTLDPARLAALEATKVERAAEAARKKRQRQRDHDNEFLTIWMSQQAIWIFLMATAGLFGVGMLIFMNLLFLGMFLFIKRRDDPEGYRELVKSLDILRRGRQ